MSRYCPPDNTPNYRYQLFAKPTGFDCFGTNKTQQDVAGGQTMSSGGIMDRKYVPPATDIRPLEQTMYIPVLPTKPGGERDITFPMTPRTLGQPDVTTACCVPVLPTQPGYRNLTSHIYPTAAEICSHGNACHGNMELKHQTCDNDGILSCCKGEKVVPPRNLPGDHFVGVPDTFPVVNMRQELPASQGYNVPNVPPSVGMPHLYTQAQPRAPVTDTMRQGQGMPEDRLEFGGTNAVDENGCGGLCHGSDHFKDKSLRTADVTSRQETMEERKIRLSTMFGAYGSCMMAKPEMRRSFYPVDNIKQQGNGFHWDYPQNSNKLCYVLDRKNVE